jgi:hypothetical protein
VHSRLAAHIDQPGDGHAERVADPGERGQVRVRASPLQRDEDALAHPGTRRQLVQGPAAIGPEPLEGPRDSDGDVGWFGHVSVSMGSAFLMLGRSVQ